MISDTKVVLDYKVTKFEWYTQLGRAYAGSMDRCFGLQSYKIWVIYTTQYACCLLQWHVVLDYKVTKFEWYTQPLCKSKLYRLVVLDYKVTKFEWYTQPYRYAIRCSSVVLDYKVTKFEWYTQLCLVTLSKFLVVLDYKVTKFEWYTQPLSSFVSSYICCFGLQSYKIWVIYTTRCVAYWQYAWLFWITKLQNLSDIHNCHPRDSLNA